MYESNTETLHRDEHGSGEGKKNSREFAAG
jgi:hypothetical protein